MNGPAINGHSISMQDVIAADPGTLFDENYFQTGLGVPYERNAYWLNFFGSIANEIVRSLKPNTVLDAGCAFGFLVESLWDRGVDCRGLDVSAYAISQVRRDIQPYCQYRSILEPIEGRYDLIACIEVLEHLLPEQTEAAIANLTSATDTILFSSTPTDLSEATHFNVRPVIGWLNLFSQFGFWPDCAFNADFVAPHAILLRRRPALSQEVLVLVSESIRLKCAIGEREPRIAKLNQQIKELNGQITELNGQITELTAQASELATLRQENNQKSEELKLLQQRGANAAERFSLELASARETNFRKDQQLKDLQAERASTLARLEAALKRLNDGIAAQRVVLSSVQSQLATKAESLGVLSQRFSELTSRFNSVIGQMAQVDVGRNLNSGRLLARTCLKELWLATTGRRSKLLRDRRQMLRDVNLVASSQYFDSAWYLEEYPDVACTNENPLLHYVKNGATESRNPGPSFDAQWYCNNYSDVSAAGLNPLLHYLKFGSLEGRAIRSPAVEEAPAQLERQADLIAGSSLFDSKWYLENYADVAAAGADPLLHYVQHGGAERRNPGPDFDANWYLDQNPDVAAAGLNPLLHYLEFGQGEGREVRSVQIMPEVAGRVNSAASGPGSKAYELVASSPLFDSQWYLSTYPDVAKAGMDPIVHYLEYGAAEPLNPGPAFDAAWYLRTNPDVAAAGMNPLVHYQRNGTAEGRAIRPVVYAPTVDEAIRERFSGLRPLRVFPIPVSSRRITIVTDSINSGSLYGGVGTALILATLLAKHLKADLRLVTRTEAAVATNFGDLLAVNGIAWGKDIEFLYSPVDGTRAVGLSENDLFLTTSWWTTRAVREVVPPSQILYLLQEDERMFYPFGDERLRCEETLNDPEICTIVNSQLLFEHLTTGPDALRGLQQRGLWFEPAFPEANYHPESAVRGEAKKRFLFYARPKNLRNLYWRGLESLEIALSTRVFSPDGWEFHFIGHSIENVSLSGGVKPTILQNLPWGEYAKVTRKTDVALCLMDTPHPSYPPLDLAASGAVVVTNRRGLKTSLARYSENIISADPTVEGLTAGLRSAVAIASNESVRTTNYSRNRLNRDWNVALEHVVRRIAGLIHPGRQ